MTNVLCALALVLADPKQLTSLSISDRPLLTASIAENGLFAAGIDEDGRVIHVDVANRKTTTLVEKSSATEMALSTTGKELALIRATPNGRGVMAELWTVPAQKPRNFEADGLDPELTIVCLAPNGLALHDHNRIAVWSRSQQGDWTEQSPELTKFRLVSNITATGTLWAFSPQLDGIYPISLTAKTLYHSGHRLKAPHGAAILSIATSPDGRLAAVGWNSGHVHIINSQAESIQLLQPGKEAVIRLGFGTSGTTVLAAMLDGAHILPVGKGIPTRIDSITPIFHWDDQSKTILFIDFDGSLEQMSLRKN